MNTQVATLASVQEKVRQRIQETFTDLIPAELWQSMVSAEIERFTKQELPQLVKQQAKEHLFEMVKAELASPMWADRWSGRNTLGPDPSPMITSIIKECAPDLVAALFGSLGQQIVQNIRNGSIRTF